jgi:hypothetical protein
MRSAPRVGEKCFATPAEELDSVRMTRLQELLSNASPSIRDIASHLEGIDGAQRTVEIRSLSGAEQAKLFDLAEGFRPLTLDDMVPQGVGPLVGVHHYGKNNLPLFPHFAKVFCRPNDGSTDVLWGYNASGSVPDLFAGPGYFVLRATDVAGEMLVDYTQIPKDKPASWPAIVPNKRGIIPRLVFGDMGDVLRGVTTNVSIGRAYRSGKAMNNWFALNRE